MNKHWGKLASIVCFLFLFAWTVSADQQPDQGPEAAEKSLAFIMKAMKESGATPDTIQMHYGTAYRTYRSLDEFSLLAKHLGEEMGLEWTANNDPHEYQFNRFEQGVHTELRVMVSPDSAANQLWESYITVRLTAKTKDQEALQTQVENVYKVLEKADILPQFNSCVQGKYSGTLKNDVQLMKINQLFHVMGATVVEKVEDSTVKSYSGYTSGIAQSIMTNGHKMNVQAGLHVDQREQVTRLTIGTPIITMEY
jgi:hypothetical protein